MILALRTDKPTAEIYLYNNTNQVDEYSWIAERKLADELLIKIQDLLTKNAANFDDLTGIIVFGGSGSFTGLRIGTTIANSVAYAQSIPVTDARGEDWIERGLQKLKVKENPGYVIPIYDAEPNITSPKPKT